MDERTNERTNEQKKRKKRKKKEPPKIQKRALNASQYGSLFARLVDNNNNDDEKTRRKRKRMWVGVYFEGTEERRNGWSWSWTWRMMRCGRSVGWSAGWLR